MHHQHERFQQQTQFCTLATFLCQSFTSLLRPLLQSRTQGRDAGCTRNAQGITEQPGHPAHPCAALCGTLLKALPAEIDHRLSTGVAPRAPPLVDIANCRAQDTGSDPNGLGPSLIITDAQPSEQLFLRTAPGVSSNLARNRRWKCAISENPAVIAISKIVRSFRPTSDSALNAFCSRNSFTILR